MANVFTEFSSQATARNVVLQKLKLALVGKIPQEMIKSLQITESYDVFTRELVYRLETAVMQLKDEELKDKEVVERPADWWEAFKQRWFPAWLKRRYPVRMEEIAVGKTYLTRICPHLESDRQGTHLSFMMYNAGDIDGYIQKEREARRKELWKQGFDEAMRLMGFNFSYQGPTPSGVGL